MYVAMALMNPESGENGFQCLTNATNAVVVLQQQDVEEFNAACTWMQVNRGTGKTNKLSGGINQLLIVLFKSKRSNWYRYFNDTRVVYKIGRCRKLCLELAAHAAIMF